jgi:GT2 family glycosyltransferase
VPPPAIGDPARFAVVVTHNRPTELGRCLAAISPQVLQVLVVDNASDPPAEAPAGLRNVVVVRDLEQPPNLSRLWNAGLDAVEKYRPEAVDVWDVAVLNDDAEPPEGWMAAVAGGIRATGAAAGCSVGARHPATVVHGPQAPANTGTRLHGWAFVIRGETGLRADERLRWWCGDDDLSAKARQAGGLVHVPGFPVPNYHADTTTVGVLAEQAGRDMQTFVDLWGHRPW